MVAAYHSQLRATAAFVGGSNITTTFRDPQRGHFNRLSSRDNGKSRPLVHTRVSVIDVRLEVKVAVVTTSNPQTSQDQELLTHRSLTYFDDLAAIITHVNEVNNIVRTVDNFRVCSEIQSPTFNLSRRFYLGPAYGISSRFWACFSIRQLRNSFALATSDARGEHDAVPPQMKRGHALPPAET